MTRQPRSRVRRLLDVMSIEAHDRERHLARLQFVERHVGLPVRTVIICLLLYFLFFSRWFDYLSSTREVLLDPIRLFFFVYTVVNLAVGALLVGMNQLPLKLVQGSAIILWLADALMIAALTLVTGGYDSILFWFYPVLIFRNALSLPVPAPQMAVNIASTLCYLWAGLLDISISGLETEFSDAAELGAAQPLGPALSVEPFLLRLFVMFLGTLWCYAMEVLVDRRQAAEGEAREFQLRQQQLEATGRLAAEIAHQLKNPLGIINSSAFSIQKAVRDGRGRITQQIQIIREEVARSDRILTDLMGYARLAEGKVERLDTIEEVDRALAQVFPEGSPYAVEVTRDYALGLPALLMQRGHLSEVLVNILQNAREAMDGKGKIWATIRYGEDYSVVIQLRDNGPGIPAGVVAQVFEPYFTTKPRGTGLGLAIVKHNTELYGGRVSVQSVLGQGTEFTLEFPARSLIRLKK